MNRFGVLTRSCSSEEELVSLVMSHSSVPFHGLIKLFSTPIGQQLTQNVDPDRVPSLQTWKWHMAPWKTVFLYCLKGSPLP